MGISTRLMTGALVLGILAAACGGAEPEPPKAPETTAVATTPPAPVAPPEQPAPPKPSQAELIQKSGMAMMEGWQQHDAKKIAMQYSENAVVKMPGAPDLTGREAIQKEIQSRFDAFSNAKTGAAFVMMKGDVGVTVFQFTGTHTGEFHGIKPTDKPVGFMGAVVSWYDADGLVKEAHEYMDATTVMAQVGVIKGKARPIPTVSEKPTFVPANDADGEAKRVEATKAWYAALDAKKDADVLGGLSDDAVYDDLSQAEPMKGKDQNKKALAAWFKAFPDGKNTPSNVWGFGDYVVVENAFTGTHKGQLGPMKATNKSVTIHGLDVLQFANGKVTHVWAFSNGGELLAQLGMMPKPGAGAASKPAAGAAPKPAAPAAAPKAATAAPAKPKTDVAKPPMKK